MQNSGTFFILTATLVFPDFASSDLCQRDGSEDLLQREQLTEYRSFKSFEKERAVQGTRGLPRRAVYAGYSSKSSKSKLFSI